MPASFIILSLVTAGDIAWPKKLKNWETLSGSPGNMALHK